MAQFSVYAHLTPTTHPDKICETLKLTVNSSSTDSSQEESKNSQARGDSINDLVTQIREFLST